MKIEQETANNSTKQITSITIVQNPGSNQLFSSTLYQWGRKDAFPGIDDIKDGTFVANGGNAMSIKNGIQHPGTFYTWGTSWYNGYHKENLWSMESGYSSTAIKTIYDPCPVGFRVPDMGDFHKVKTSDNVAVNPTEIGITGALDVMGLPEASSGSMQQVLYLPYLGYRNGSSGLLNKVGNMGCYWLYKWDRIIINKTLYSAAYTQTAEEINVSSYGFSVYPVAE